MDEFLFSFSHCTSHRLLAVMFFWQMPLNLRRLLSQGKCCYLINSTTSYIYLDGASLVELSSDVEAARERAGNKSYGRTKEG